MDRRELVKIAKKIQKEHVVYSTIAGEDVCYNCMQINDGNSNPFYKWPCDARMLANLIITTLRRSYVINEP